MSEARAATFSEIAAHVHSAALHPGQFRFTEVPQIHEMELIHPMNSGSPTEFRFTQKNWVLRMRGKLGM